MLYMLYKRKADYNLLLQQITICFCAIDVCVCIQISEMYTKMLIVGIRGRTAAEAYLLISLS